MIRKIAFDRYVTAQSTHSMRVTAGGRLLYTHGPLEEMNPELVRNRPFGYVYMWWVFDVA